MERLDNEKMFLIMIGAKNLQTQMKDYKFVNLLGIMAKTFERKKKVNNKSFRKKIF